ncbi:hypothetical protein V502_04869 [Pseudogymnoascus sp. VKM F-4520 (FW-2644)]|nr:hypothetical protein V502_04869 [Pseudogymnoascus sp. VKM F-4520 (FW-2644)]
MTSTGQQIKAAAIAKAKSAVSSATTNGSNGSASKKRRGNNQLKPIITNDTPKSADTPPTMTSNSTAGK